MRDLNTRITPFPAHVLGYRSPAYPEHFGGITLCDPFALDESCHHLSPHGREVLPDHDIADHNITGGILHAGTWWASRFW